MRHLKVKRLWGVEYYQAVIRDGVRTYAGFEEWRKSIRWRSAGMDALISLISPSHILFGWLQWNFVLLISVIDSVGEY